MTFIDFIQFAIPSELAVLFVAIFWLGKYQSRSFLNSMKMYFSVLSCGLVKSNEQEFERLAFAIGCNFVVIFFNLFITISLIVLKELCF